MAVEFKLKSKDCFCFGVANSTWFHLLNASKIKEILKNLPLTNDQIKATKKQALACAEVMKDWQPSSFGLVMNQKK